MKRAALYVRVSTQEQKKHGLSVDNQILALQEFCKENGYIVAGLYNDAGISARKRYTRRPALLKLMDDCQNEKIDIILFTKLDRWFRSVGDYYEVQNVLDKCHVPWKCIWEDYETETSAGMFKVNIMLSVAQSEADRTSERLKATFAYKRERGDYLGKAPLGYKVIGGSLVKNEKTRTAMEVFFKTYLETMSTSKAMRAAKEYGLLVERNHILRLLHNTVYCGEAAGGYQCEPYVTKEEFQAILQNLARHTRHPKNFDRTYIFSGLCKCGYCGHIMTARAVRRTHADGTRVIHKKYECRFAASTIYNCPPNQATEPTLERYLLSDLDKIIGQYQIEAEAKNKLLNPNAMSKRKSIEAKISRLTFLYEEGDISAEDYKAKRDKLKAELSLINVEPIQPPKSLPENWREIYLALDDEHKQIFWRKTIKSIIITKGNRNAPIVKVELN